MLPVLHLINISFNSLTYSKFMRSAMPSSFLLKKTTTSIFSLTLGIALGISFAVNPSANASASLRSTIKSFFHHDDQNSEDTLGSSNTVALKDPVAIVNGKKISKSQLENYVKQSLSMTGVKLSAIPEAQKIRMYHQVVDQLIMQEILDEKAKDTQVADEEINDQLDVIKKQLSTTIKDFDKLSPDQKNRKLDKALEDLLEKQGYTLDKAKGEMRDQLRRAKWATTLTKGEANVTEADAKKFYDQNIKKFESPEQVRASHILFMVPPSASKEEIAKKEKEAKEALARAKKGEDFSKLATELSEDPSAKQNGGDLNYFSKAQMDPQFSQAAFTQKVGTVSQEPVRTSFGYHIIKVTDKRPAGTLSFDEVKDDIINMLKSQKTNKIIMAEIEKARQASKIEIFLPPVPAPKKPVGKPVFSSTAGANKGGASPAPSATPAK
jgi:peptidyl-prolyl cis-trans isomerase C